MEHRSTFDLTVGNALLWQGDVMAEIGRDHGGDWCVEAIYADPIEVDGKCPTTRHAWVQIPVSHWLHTPVRMHFMLGCRDEISERWDRHKWRYAPIRSRLSAGRTL